MMPISSNQFMPIVSTESLPGHVSSMDSRRELIDSNSNLSGSRKMFNFKGKNSIMRNSSVPDYPNSTMTNASMNKSKQSFFSRSKIGDSHNQFRTNESKSVANTGVILNSTISDNKTI